MTPVNKNLQVFTVVDGCFETMFQIAFDSVALWETHLDKHSSYLLLRQDWVDQTETFISHDSPVKGQVWPQSNLKKLQDILT